MGKIKELNVKNQYKYIDIYYIGYITVKKIGDCENINSVIPMYLIIHSATGYFKEMYGEKYLVLDSTEKHDEVFSGIKKKIETINGGKELFYEKNYARIGVNTDDDVPLNKPLKFPTFTIIIRCVFQEGKKLYFLYMSKCEPKKSMTNSNLIDKKGVL